MTTHNNYRKLGAAFALAAALGLTGQIAQAGLSVPLPAVSAISASAIDVELQPGSEALPSFVFTFDANYDLAGFDVSIEFDSTKLSFNAAASKFTTSAGTSTLAEAFSALKNGSCNFLGTPDLVSFPTEDKSGLFSFGGAFLDPMYSLPIAAGSSITLTGVFNMLPGFKSGSALVRVYGNAGDAVFNSLDEFDVTAAVSAVPEPETWLMLLGGLGLVASRVRRHKR